MVFVPRSSLYHIRHVLLGSWTTHALVAAILLSVSPLGGAEIDQAAFGQQVDLVTIGERVLIDLRLDVSRYHARVVVEQDTSSGGP